MPIVLECEHVRHAFGRGDLAEVVLRGVSASFSAGQTCLLMGPSGSGKTTLLSIFGCLLSPSEGRLYLAGQEVQQEAPEQLTELRRDKLGFVFQHAQLLPFLTVLGNLEVVGRNAGLPRAELARRIADLLGELDLEETAGKYPHQLSGGQRQRVAVARAVLHRPPVLLADEPTAALDWEHGQAVVRLLIAQAAETGAMLLAVSHDARLLPLFDRRLRIERGVLAESYS